MQARSTVSRQLCGLAQLGSACHAPKPHHTLATHKAGAVLSLEPAAALLPKPGRPIDPRVSTADGLRLIACGGRRGKAHGMIRRGPVGARPQE